MTTYLFAGGGTAGHVNPLLAVGRPADASASPDATVLVLGTAEGLESRLVPMRGYELLTDPAAAVPAPAERRGPALPGSASRRRSSGREQLIREHERRRRRRLRRLRGRPGLRRRAAHRRPDRRARGRTPSPGMANRLGAFFTQHVGVDLLGHAPAPRPRRSACRCAARSRPSTAVPSGQEALAEFGLDPRPADAARDRRLVGRAEHQRDGRTGPPPSDRRRRLADPARRRGQSRTSARATSTATTCCRYCDRMDLAYAAADFVVSRAGAGTVCELTAVGLPAVLVPYPVGNGEQRHNATRRRRGRRRACSSPTPTSRPTG